MPHPTLEDLASGKCVLPLTGLSLCFPEGPSFSGGGTLHVLDGQVRVTAVTQGGGEIIRQMISKRGTPGLIRPDAHYLRLDAGLRDGGRVVTDNVRFTGYDAHAATGHVVWDIPPGGFDSQVEITRTDDNFRCGPNVEAIFEAASWKTWTRRSMVVDDHPIFGATNDRLDWLQFESGSGGVCIRQSGDGQVRVHVRAAESGQGFRVCSAVGRAMSMLLGRHVRLIAMRGGVDGNEVTRLNIDRQRPTANAFAAPFSNDLTMARDVESMLACFTNFFAEESSRRMGDLLSACRDVMDQNLTTQGMVHCATVEALVEKECVFPDEVDSAVKDESSKKESVDWPSFVGDVKEAVEGMPVQERIKQRFRSMMDRTNERSVRTTLHNLRTNRYAGINREEVVAWTKLRNNVMHGDPAVVGEDDTVWQKAITRHYRVMNLINKLVMAQADYRGRFFSYPDWSVTTFEPLPSTATGPDA